MELLEELEFRNTRLDFEDWCEDEINKLLDQWEDEETDEDE